MGSPKLHVLPHSKKSGFVFFGSEPSYGGVQFGGRDVRRRGGRESVPARSAGFDCKDRTLLCERGVPIRGPSSLPPFVSKPKQELCCLGSEGALRVEPWIHGQG